MNVKKSDGVGNAWGESADPDLESMFMRRVIFSVLLAVVGLMGFWFLVTTLRGAEGTRRILSVNDTAADGPRAYTVKLLEFPREKQAVAESFMNTPTLQQLASPHACSLLELPSGRLALCVGRFTDEDSPQLQELLQRCRQFHHEAISFSDATVLGYRE